MQREVNDLSKLVFQNEDHDKIENIDKFIDNSVSSYNIFIYYLYSIPWFISIALPMSILISTVFLFNIMQKNHELTALKASGIGLIRISIPLFIIGVLLSILSFKFENTIVTKYSREKINLEQEYNLKRSSRKAVRKNDIFKIINPNSGNLDSQDHSSLLVSDLFCDGQCDSLGTVIVSIKKFKYIEEVGRDVSIQYLKKNNNEYQLIKRLDSPKFIWKNEILDVEEQGAEFIHVAVESS